MTSDGTKPLLDKVNAITAYPRPEKVHDLRRFIGMVNFYRDSIPNAARIQAPLNAYLRNSKKRDKTKIDWNNEALQAFELCKASIQNAALLAHPSPSPAADAISLMCDASNTCAGAVLQQCVNNKWIPLGYFSKKFTDTQQRYSTFDRELLSIHMSIKHFRKMFEERELVVYTDHSPLIYAIRKPPSDNDTQRRTRQQLFISEFTTDIRHVSGVKNVVAEALSRIETVDLPSPSNYDDLSQAQERDSVIPDLLKQTNIQLKKIVMPGTNKPIFCETSTSHVRP